MIHVAVSVLVVSGDGGDGDWEEVKRDESLRLISSSLDNSFFLEHRRYMYMYTCN